MLAGAGLWLKNPGNRWYLKHGIWAQIRSRRHHSRDEGADSSGAQSDSIAGPGQASAAPSQGASPSSAPAALGTIRVAKQRKVGSTNNSLPNGLEMDLVPDRTISPAAMILKFTGEVGEIHSSIDSADVLDGQSGIILSSPDTVVLEWRSPPFGPFAPLLLTVFSKDPIKLEKATMIPYRYPFEGGDLK